jgi:uncharacterized protein DUF899
VTEHKVGTREEWLAARRDLLEREKELIRLNDELARERRELPWVPVEKEYTFETHEGTKTLAELFDGRSQLLAYHLMFGPEWTAACPRAERARCRSWSRRARSGGRERRRGGPPEPSSPGPGLQAAHGLDFPLRLIIWK